MIFCLCTLMEDFLPSAKFKRFWNKHPVSSIFFRCIMTTQSLFLFPFTVTWQLYTKRNEVRSLLCCSFSLSFKKSLFKEIIFGPLPGTDSSSNGNWVSSYSNSKEPLVLNSADAKSESPFWSRCSWLAWMTSAKLLRGYW